ncbi:MAG: hypothetical protein J6X61_02340 [Clostridia bacterium]|nr:hypothetical protein [Clostridia bacterium]
MNRKQFLVLFRLLCAGLVLTLLAGCAGADPLASSAAASSRKDKSGGDAPSGEPVRDDASSQTASSEGTGSVADIPQKEADPVAVAETEEGNKSSFDVSKTGLLQAYPEYDERIERDYAYTVTVTQGANVRSLTCYNHCDTVASSDRTLNGDSVRRFCEFAFADAPVRVDVAVKQDFKTYTVMPTAKGYKSELHGNVISIYMEKPDYILLKLDDLDDSILTILADAPETDVPQKGDPNVLYIEGWYQPDSWHLDVTKSNYTVYLAPGSVLDARVVITGQNVTVKGRGMILDPFSDIYHYDVDTDFNVGGSTARILNVRGKNCTIDGIKLIDARTFNLIVSASNVKVTNFKVLSSEMCTDGITQSGANNVYEHCFIYNGDNGIVINGGDNQQYRDITIGTICCGIFPQENIGQINITDLYLFRCDEGLMRNLYNTSQKEKTFTITMTNVSCVDVDHFPFLFMGGNMGTKEKNIIFKNLAIPYATGANNQFVANETKQTIKRGSSTSGNLETSNYNLIFDGLSIGGKAVTDPMQIPCADSLRGSFVNITVKGNGATWPVKAAAVTANVTAPDKIFIGARQLFLKDAAVEQNGTWYVPAADVCKALGCAVPSDTTKMGGVAYLSLDALKESGCTTSATYDAAAKAIRIAAVDRGANLIDEAGTSVHSHWGEFICYNIYLLYRKDAVGGEYYIIHGSSSSGKGAGAYYMLTQQVKQYGKGTYTFSVDLRADKACSAQTAFTLNRVNATKTVDIGTTWKRYTFEFTCAKEMDEVFQACVKVLCTENTTPVYFRNPVVTHSK